MATINGTDGNDTLIGGDESDTITGGNGNDSLGGGGGADSLVGGNGNDSLDGGAGDDSLAGGDGEDRLIGGAGMDTLVAFGGGVDAIDYGTSFAGVVIDFANSIVPQDGFGSGDTLVGAFFIAIGSPFADSITHSENTLGETLMGAAGDDTLIGGFADEVEGGAGADQLVLRLFEELRATFSYRSSPAGVVVDLPSGTAQDGFGSVDTLIVVELETPTNDGPPQIMIIGSAFGDSLIGGQNYGLVGGAGDDSLLGGSAGFLIGGPGNDVIMGGPGADVLIYGGSISRILGFSDFLASAGAMVDLGIGIAQDGFGTTDTLSGIEAVAGSCRNDTLIGDGGGNSFVGDQGNDVVMGGAGSDTAVYFFDRVTYAIEFGLDATIVTAGPGGLDGSDTLTGIEFLQFGGSAEEPPEIVPVPAFVSIANASMAEGDGGNTSLVFTLSLTNTPSETVRVTATTANGPVNGGAQAGSDYTATSLEVTIPAGVTSGTFSVPITGDTVIEPDETFTVTLSDPVGALLGTQVTATGTILNDDQPPVLSIANASVSEGNSATSNLIFTITRSGSLAGAVTVTATTSNGTATAGSDYTAKTQVVTIAGGQTSATFSVVVSGDTVFEPDETLTVTLSNPVGATLGAQAAATGTIVNDDSAPVAPTVSISGASVAEGNGGAMELVFTISLSAPAAQEVSVQAATQDESAKAGGDYAATSSTVTIPAGQTSATFSVPVTGDTSIEIDESLTVALSNATGGATISVASARGFILNDDLTPGITINGQTVNGTAGDDFLVAGAANDSVNGQGGSDTEFGNEQSDILLGGVGNDFILGDFPGNFLDGSGDFIDAGDGNDNVFGGGGDDTVFGGPGDDLIGGDFGDNLIFGGDGNNALIGFGGADTIEGGNDGDIVFGLSGPDVISTKGGFDLIIAGGDLDGPEDSDFIDVADGGSQVFAGSGDDTILAGSGEDFVLGESGNDRITTGGGNDVLIAGPGNDTLSAGAGNDLLIPEGGDDVIAGGAGADVFRYPSGIAVGEDRINGFAPADDTVELGAALGFATAGAALAAVTQVGTDVVLTLPGGAGSITFAGVQASALTAADFVIV